MVESPIFQINIFYIIIWVNVIVKIQEHQKNINY